MTEPEPQAEPSGDAQCADPSAQDPSPAAQAQTPAGLIARFEALSTPARLAAAAGFVGLVLVVGVFLGRKTAPAAPVPEVAASPAAEPGVWTCSMHPQIRNSGPGACPLCGMDLIPATAAASDLGSRELVLSESAAALAEIETVPVQRRDLVPELRLVGKVDYDETRLEFITAWVGGRLDRLFVDYTGTPVQEGDHLVEVYSPQLLSAQEELLQALRSQTRLQAGGSPLLRETADRTVASSREKLRLLGLAQDQVAAIESTGTASEHMTIRASGSGVVVHKNKNTGDYVKTGERIYTIADLSQVWVKLDAYESDLPWIRFGQTVRFSVEALPGEAFEGQVVFVAPVLSGDTRTVKLRLNVPNPDGRLKPGMFVRGVLFADDPDLTGSWLCPMHPEVRKQAAGDCDLCGMPLAEAKHVVPESELPVAAPLVVPRSAVLWTGVRSLVYVREPGDTPRFVGQEVVLGPRVGAFYVVREGLAEGQLVVTRGAFKLDSALQLEARPSMMLPPERPAEPQQHTASAEFLEALGPVYTQALAWQAALAGDDAAAAQVAAEALGEALHAVDAGLLTEGAHGAYLPLAKQLRDSASAGAEVAALTPNRVAFGEASGALLELVRSFGHLGEPLSEAYCPMAFDNAGAAWLQRGAQIANPYFGASMLRCGEVRETFAPRSAASTRPGGRR